jgi:DNA (cytosine-5)-methyltransferase 1
MSRPPFTFYEFFAGGGMARLGLEAGWDCLFANDFDAAKAAAYRDNFDGGHFVEGDVWGLTAADLPDAADLAWASSPCQDFSLAGARAGLAGGRSSALLGFWRLIEALGAENRAPRVVVIENVAGLVTSNGGRDLEAIAAAFTDQGYAFGLIEIDAARFLPQSRRRVLIVGSRDKDVARRLADAEAALPHARNTDLAAILEPDDEVAWRSDAQTQALIALMDRLHRARLDAARASGERRVGAVFRRVRAGVQRAEVRFDGLAGCLRTPRGGSSRQSLLVVDGGAVRSRLITPREAARLMGLPETYRLPKSSTAALHLTGDGVAVPVVRWLADRILEPLLNNPDAKDRRAA